ncbi:hypothetical protein PK98_15400 [Croceibacterium mercuriale]|uniref:Uncharacterized protein n=1 Tax=Croceibacterium mercuriale TaxID=1572751 RepID=A0A0B2BRJ9_9SPHN|nr:hypothetical protein PK98_15400 [Croceibacterium mercuriale]
MAFAPPQSLPIRHEEDHARQRLAKKQSAKRNRKTVLKIPAGAMRAVEAAVPLIDPGRQPQVTPQEPSDLGKAAFHRVLSLRDRLAAFTADHGAPADLAAACVREVQDTIALGARSLDSVIDPDADGYLGCDFGTSATKAVVRWPYDAARLPFAMPVPADWCSHGSPHLWPTTVYFEATSGRFSAVPQPGFACLQGFKTGLVERKANRTCCGSPVRMDEAAVAFLALYLAWCTGVLAARGAALSGVNVAVPLSISDVHDAQVAAPYKRVVRAAALLVDRAATLTLADVRHAMEAGDEPALPCEIWPELSGAVAGYCASSRPHSGDHFLLDCGSATFDIASFRLDPGSDRPAAIYATIVETLGADSCRVYQRHGASAADCRRAVEFQDHRSRVLTRDCKGGPTIAARQDGRRGEQVILIGGGIGGPIHGEVVERLQRAFERQFHRPELDRNLQCEERVIPGRLILADGLARDPVELSEVVRAVPVVRSDERMQPGYHDFAERM